MKPYERKQLLERIDRDGATVGSQIPERITIDGTPFDLREFVFEIKRLDSLPADQRERVEAAKKKLRRERREYRAQIESGEIDYTEGERLTQIIIGIDRALNALDQLESTDLAQEIAAREAADQKRWLSFLRQVTDSDGRSGRTKP